MVITNENKNISPMPAHLVEQQLALHGDVGLAAICTGAISFILGIPLIHFNWIGLGFVAYGLTGILMGTRHAASIIMTSDNIVVIDRGKRIHVWGARELVSIRLESLRMNLNPYRPTFIKFPKGVPRTNVFGIGLQGVILLETRGGEKYAVRCRNLKRLGGGLQKLGYAPTGP